MSLGRVVEHMLLRNSRDEETSCTAHRAETAVWLLAISYSPPKISPRNYCYQPSTSLQVHSRHQKESVNHTLGHGPDHRRSGGQTTPPLFSAVWHGMMMKVCFVVKHTGHAKIISRFSHIFSVP